MALRMQKGLERAVLTVAFRDGVWAVDWSGARAGSLAGVGFRAASYI